MHQLQQAITTRSIYLLRMASKVVLPAQSQRMPQGRAIARTFVSSQGGTLLPKPTQLVAVSRRFMADIVEEGAGTHRPSAFQKRIMVLAKMYPSVDKVPQRVTRNQLSVAMDKFRVRACIIMVAITFISAAIVALIGRRERQQGKTVTSIAESRRQS